MESRAAPTRPTRRTCSPQTKDWVPTQDEQPANLAAATRGAPRSAAVLVDTTPANGSAVEVYDVTDDPSQLNEPEHRGDSDVLFAAPLQIACVWTPTFADTETNVDTNACIDDQADVNKKSRRLSRRLRRGQSRRRDQRLRRRYLQRLRRRRDQCRRQRLRRQPSRCQ